MAQETYEDEPTIPFDEPALALANGDETDPLEAAINGVTRDDRVQAEERGTGQREISISQDVSGDSTGTGEYNDFEKFFKDKYEKISEILEKRNYDAPIKTISSMKRGASQGNNDVILIGMVFDKWTSRNDHQMLMMDDTTGSMKVVFTDEEVKERCINILEDEVIAIEGQVSDDGEIVFGNEFYQPDIPSGFRGRTADRDVKAAMISDVHFGSKDFSAHKWNRFVDWVRQQGDIEYILVSGDIVEGIGVYPGQKDELIVPSITDQYKVAAEGLKELPDDVDIICSVGNHDSVRLAEPQPTLPEKFREMFADNVTFVGNPAMVDLEGVKFLLYHGMSLNPLIEALPDIDIHEPTSAMEPLLKRRHLVPTWGNGIQIAPEKEDYLTIETIPDFLHCGHVHTYGLDKYHNVTMVNTGCWQERTDFQKSKNVFPDVGHAPVVNLGTGEVQEFQF